MQEAQGFPYITEQAAGFGGGIGGEQDVCGAITGGVIAIGYREGQRGGNQIEIARAARPAVRDIYEGFQAKFGAVDCRALIGYDYRDPVQFEQAHKDPARAEKCRIYKEWVIRRLLAEGQ
jgi:C_GCAxxG_C_C family probable redox protein